MPNMMNCVYELKRDPDGIAGIQRASLDNPYGLTITHGLVGSAEWWQQVASGSLPTQRRLIWLNLAQPDAEADAAIPRDCP